MNFWTVKIPKVLNGIGSMRMCCPLWVADMDFVSPEPVIRALQERVAHGVFGYPADLPGLREVIVNRLAQKYQWAVNPEDLVFVPGVVSGFNIAAQAFVEEGSGVLIQPPVYMPFLKVANNVKGSAAGCAPHIPGGWVLQH